MGGPLFTEWSASFLTHTHVQQSIIVTQAGDDMKCLICDQNFDLGKRLSDHVKRDHSMSSEDYTVKCLLGGARPACPSCGGQTRYVALSFKRYCSDCKSVAAI